MLGLVGFRSVERDAHKAAPLSAESAVRKGVIASQTMWIRVIPPQESDGRLGRIYESIRTADGHIDNVLQIHSLRPRTLEGHLALYKAVLHTPTSLCRRGSESWSGSMSRH